MPSGRYLAPVSAKEATGPTITPLAGLIDSEISPEPSQPREASLILIQESIAAPATESAPAAFERATLNFLAEHREALGIRSVWRYKNARIDALVELTDGRRLAVEVKFRMNWEKACQACAQVGWFRTRGNPIDGGIVIFEEFTGDWAREKGRWRVEPGWSYFYTDHRRVEGVRVDLLRLRAGKLESFVDALVSAGMTTGVPTGLTTHVGRAAGLREIDPVGLTASNSTPLTLAEMGFAIRDDCDQTPNAWRFVAAGAPFLTPSPNGMHLRGIRQYIAIAETANASVNTFIACRITKSYASGGSDGSLDLIDLVDTLAQAVAGANRRLREWLTDDEIDLSELQRTEPDPMDATNIESALANGGALFTGDWGKVDDEANRRYSGSDVRWAMPDKPVILYYDPAPN